MEIREKIDIIKVSVDILKTKLIFFAGLVGGDIYLLINYDKISQFVNQYVIFIVFIVLGFYATLGVFLSLTDLNFRKIELEDIK